MLKDQAIKEAFENAKEQISTEEPQDVEQRSGCMRHRMNTE
jgi:hypothetical protein